MTANAVAPGGGLSPLEPEDDFWLQARRVERPNGEDPATFRFADDVWYLRDLLRPHEGNGSATISFLAVPEWLRRDVKRYIADFWLNSPATAPKIQDAMVALRLLGKLLSDFDGRPADLRMAHAREFAQRLGQLNYSALHNRQLQTAINRFMTFVRRHHPDGAASDFELTLPREMLKVCRWTPLATGGKVLETEVQAMIIDACLSDIQAYHNAQKTYINPAENPILYYRERMRRLKAGEPTNMLSNLHEDRPNMRDLLARAVKATLIILAICVGRRVAALCNTRVNVRTEEIEWANDAGQPERGVMVRFEEFKISNAYEDVFCPGAFGELALYAIRTAGDLTQELRQVSPQWAEFLFLIPARSPRRAKVVSPSSILRFLNGDKRDGKGLIQRRSIPVEHLTTRVFRSTRATKAWMGGMQIHEVSYDLGHVDAVAAERFYVMGDEEKRRRFQELMDHGGLSGLMVDYAGGRELVQTALGRRQVEALGTQGLIVSPTRYGYCALSGTGPCTRTTPCYLGPGVEDGGCDFHLLSPDALPALEEDKETLEASIAACGQDPGLRAWVINQRNQLEVVNLKIETARRLQTQERGCVGGTDCGCKRRINQREGAGENE